MAYQNSNRGEKQQEIAAHLASQLPPPKEAGA